MIYKCTTPNGENAECISIHNCTILLDAIKSEDKSLIQFVKDSQCGYEETALVCCGKSNNFTLLNTRLLPPRSYCGFQHSDDYQRDDQHSSSIDEFPWLAALIYKVEDLEKNLCVGSLINDRYVLTTAHCLRVPKRLGTILKVRLGEYNIEQQMDCVSHADMNECSDPTAEYGIEEIIVHDLFNLRDRINDIGLIRLNHTVQYSDYIRPICLPLAEAPRAKVGDTLFESGWGRVTQASENFAKIKKKVITKLVSKEECAQAYKRYNYTIGKGHVCTTDIFLNSTVSCAGDSGSPVMFPHKNQWFEEGIISFGLACGSGAPGVHVKVSEYIHWIVRSIRP